MKRKLFKIVTVLLVLALLVMPNFIYVGVGLASYAVSDSATNHQNIDFDAKLKEGNILNLNINVKREGYFNGEITLENSNFIFDVSQTNPDINKIESNKIVLNQINAGSNVDIDLKINPVSEETFKAGLLNALSKLTLTGIYRDSTEKNIQIKGTKEVEFKYKEENTIENVESTAKIITNKTIKISGVDKRVVQLEMKLGLKDNNYPIKEIELNMDVPKLGDKVPTIVKKVDLNTMTHYDYNNENSKINIKLTNEANENNEILWKKQGNEKIVLTFMYDDEEKSLDNNIKINVAEDNKIDENIFAQIEEKVLLYNEKELKDIAKVTLSDLAESTSNNEEIVTVSTTNSENMIYKGKLSAGIDRKYVSRTNVNVNLANAEQYLKVIENTDNTMFNNTIIKKEEFDNLLGENGQIVILNENDDVLATINSKTEADEDGNIIINYEDNEAEALEFKMTAPVLEGNLGLTNVKTIKGVNDDSLKDTSELVTTTNYEYNKDDLKETKTAMGLIDTETEADLTINKETLSTVIDNNIEMKIILKGNNEKYSLYKDPSFAIQLPNDVEKVAINSIDLIYENELKIKDYEVSGNNLIVNLEGQQTEYKNTAVEGAIVVINANLQLNKKAASKNSKITLAGVNADAKIEDSKDIRVVAPKDVTAINTIKELNVETVGQEEIKDVRLRVGTESKTLETSIELINNNENDIENVKIIGTFPTNSKQNNTNIKIAEEIKLEDVEGAKIYYSENESATEDIQNKQNAWSETINNPSEVKKYLIVIPDLASQAEIKGSYKFQVPELLEYNQKAFEGYTSKYTNALTKIESEVKSTVIKMDTGIGPILNAKLSSYVGKDEINENTSVKNGEIVKYRIELSNTGSEKINNVSVEANIPEGSKLIVPQDNYEYTGASYFKELEDRTFKTTIDSIEVGEVKNIEYEVRINAGIPENTVLTSMAQVKYGEVVKKTNETKLKTSIGEIRVSVKRVTDRKINLYETGTVQYFAIIENISNEKQENIKVKTNLPNSLKVERLELFTGMQSSDVPNEELYDSQEVEKQITDRVTSKVTSEAAVESETLEYSDLINIPTLEKGEVKVLSYDMLIDKVENNKTQFSVIAYKGNTGYESNIFEDQVNSIKVGLSMTSNVQSNYIKSGDSLQYTINIENKGTSKLNSLLINDVIPDSLTVESVLVDGEEVAEMKNQNNILVSCNIAPQSEMKMVINTTVNYSAARTSAEAITNVAYAEILGRKVATTQEINHFIEADVQPTPNPYDPDEPDPDIATGDKMITGTAWFDENGNGQKDDDEKTLNNIKVHLLNTESNKLVKNANGNVLEATTNENGVYVLDRLYSGKYIVIFEYNQTLYTLTKYRAENVEESKNSNVMMNELLIEDEKQQVPSTDIIDINNNNISNVNIGLIELKDFSFRLDKYVSRILIQNAAGTTLKEYTNATVAKAELDAKKVNGTNVIIEYEIKVTNIGELDGYVRKIVDYMPNDLKFSSELNKDWYQTGSDLFNASLANEKIPAGESRTVKLTLTKAMTENNTGLINNTAEIAESYNELGIKDSKSTAANKAQGESDYGSADTILSIKTGGDVYVTVIAIAIAVLGSITFIVIIKKQKIEDIK